MYSCYSVQQQHNSDIASRLIILGPVWIGIPKLDLIVYI